MLAVSDHFSCIPSYYLANARPLCLCRTFFGGQEERDSHLRVQRQADAYTPEELGDILDKYGAKSPAGNPITKPFPFNLMFKVCVYMAVISRG